MSDTQITDAGVEYLKRLTNFLWLNLDGSQVTDAGLAHLKGLAKLKYLFLYRTQITDAGVNDRKQSLPHLNVRR